MKQEDIITGEKLQNLCELFIGTINSINWNPKMKNDDRWIEINNILISNIMLENPKYIYICGEDIDYLPKIITFLKNPFILVIHNSDLCITEKYINYFKDDKILKVFTQNLFIHHPKFHFLPIGLANSQWNHGDLDTFCKIVNDKEIKKENYIYFYFSIDTNLRDRPECFNIISKNGLKWDKKRNFEDYLITLKKHKYAICPVGNGPDCHRFWECLYLNVIPIVINNPLIQHFKKYFKMVILESWEKFDINNLILNEPIESSLIFFDDYKNLIYG